MKRILLRSPMSPFDNFDANTVIKDDLVWYNVGNMLFPYSVWRTLMTSGTEIKKFCSVNSEKIEDINENYDSFVIPLANAFRSSFMTQLLRLTNFITNLKIPCIVTGVGLQLDMEPNLKMKHPFDDAVRDFCVAVLEKSALIGVRGEITAAYLKNMGFGSRHVTVIGCPSMYSVGRKLPELSVQPLTEQLRICVNTHRTAPEKVHRIIDKIINDYPDHYLIMQDLHELKLLYYGRPIYDDLRNSSRYFPEKPTDTLYLENRIRSFVNVKSWIDFLKQADFNIGCRIHGNVTSILAGTPSFVLATDSRIRELAEYHRIPHMRANEMTDDFELRDIYEKTDFTTVYGDHEKRFDHFIHFLELNGLDHIYQNGADGSDCPYDTALAKLNLHKPIETFLGTDKEEMARRMVQHYTLVEKKEAVLRKKIKELKR